MLRTSRRPRLERTRPRSLSPVLTDEASDQVLEEVIHHMLEGSWGIRKPEGHDCLLKKAL